VINPASKKLGGKKEKKRKEKREREREKSFMILNFFTFLSSL
jgi:hypothetical protein